MNITRTAWGEILRVLKKHKVPYTSRFVGTGVRSNEDDPESEIKDRHIQINIIIPDYFKEYGGEEQ